MKKNIKEREIPKTILGLDLPFENTEEDKRARLKFYLKDALAFAVMLTIIDLFAVVFIDTYTYLKITNNITVDYTITLLLDFTFVFLLTFLIDYLFSEDSVKKYNKTSKS